MFRVNRAGKGTFDRVIGGIGLLRRYGIEPGVIQTITRDTASRAREDFQFFVDSLRIKEWGTNVFFDAAGENAAMREQNVPIDAYTEFLLVTVDRWLQQDDADLRIREIENFLAGVVGKQAPSCTFNGACTAYFCLDYDGKVYPCDRLSGNPQYLFGDLSSQDLDVILNGDARFRYAQRVNALPGARALAGCLNRILVRLPNNLSAVEYRMQTQMPLDWTQQGWPNGSGWPNWENWENNQGSSLKSRARV